MANLSIQLRTMKRILILLLALMPIIASAQGFQIDEGAIKWQKIYESDMTISDIYKCIVVSNDFYDIQLLSDCIVAKSRPVKYVPEEYGFRWGNSNTLLLNGAIGPIFLQIDVKEGRYRVTAKDISVTDVTSGDIVPRGSVIKLEEVALDKGIPNNMMTSQFAPIFDHFLNRLTSFYKVDDDW